MTHSIIPPSSADIWVACPGWVVMAQSFPETEETEAQRLGTAAHEVAAQYIESYSRGAMFNPSIGDATSNHVVIDAEMLDACEMYADDVRTVMIASGVFGGHGFGLEKALKMPGINDYSFGTSDCFIFDHKNLTVYIWDFKYGHDPVDVFENLQLINYAAGVVELIKLHFPFVESQHGGMKFVFRIAQPRSFHRDGPVREWTTTLSGLYTHFTKLRDAATLALSGIGGAISGPHCRYCQARHGCESALNAGVRLFEVASQALPLEMSNAAIGTQLAIVSRAVKQLEAVKNALEQQVENLVRSGKSVPGYAVQPKQGRESWNVDISEVTALGDMLGVNLSKPGVVTPKQAVNLGVDINVIKAYCQRTTSGVEVVPDNGNKARSIFGAK